MKYCLSCLFLLHTILSHAQVKITLEDQAETIYPIYSTQVDSLNDLLPLKTLFADKTIVGMGEATHGTKEFFDTKARFFKFLVLHCDYKVFGIEDSYGGCSYINDYVRTGVGNIDSVMLRFDFWTWKTAELKSLLLWMKQYNQFKLETDQVVFCGFDMQNYYTPIQYLDDFFKSDTSGIAGSIHAITKPVLSETEMETYKRLQKKASKYQDTLQVVCQQLQDLISSKRSYLERNYSPIQFARLSFCLQNLQQAITNLSVANVVKFRDSCMARNVLQIQQLEHQKMFVWAHNGHVNLSYPEKVSSLMGLPMGGHLKAGLKEQYFAIGFVFNQGSFQAIKGPNTIAGAAFKYIFAKKHLYKGLQACTVPVNEKNTFTNALSHTGYPSYFININNTGNKVFSTDLKTYDIGAVFLNYKRCSDTLNAKKQFDGLIYIDQTTRAMPFNLK